MNTPPRAAELVQASPEPLSGPPSDAAGALLAVRQWRERAEQAHTAELLEVDAQIRSLRDDLAALNRKLDNVSDYRDKVVARDAAIAREASRRAHDGLFRALGLQAKALAVRAQLAAEAEAARAKAIDAALEAQDIASEWEAYRAFDPDHPSLRQLPAPYVEALLSHHEANAHRIAEAIAQADPGPTPLDAPQVHIDVLFTVGEPTDQEPALLSVVIPVDDTLSRRDGQADGLPLQVAARVASAMYETAHAFGHLAAQTIQGGHRGRLALEVEVPGASAAQLRERFEATLASVAAGASELTVARLSLAAQHVEVAHLLPPEITNHGLGVTGDA